MNKIRTLLCLVLAFGAASRLHATNYYMTLAGAGAKTGVDWANALAVTSIGATTNTNMQPGDTLFLGSGSYGDTRFGITSAGTAAARKYLVGVDTGSGLPDFKGIQSTRSYTTVTMYANASYWTIKNLVIEHRDMGISAAGPNAGLVIENVSVIDTKSKGYSFTDCDNLWVKNCSSYYYTEAGFMCNNSCDGVTFTDCIADMTWNGTMENPARKTSVDSPIGFNFNVKGSTAANNTNILLQDCETLNNDSDDGATYEQGDGFKMERGNSGVTFVRCFSHDNQDGAFDLKGDNQTLINCIGETSHYGFKLWYYGTLDNCIALNNNARQVTIAATTTGFTFNADHCTFHGLSTAQVGMAMEAANTMNVSNSLFTFAGTLGTSTGSTGTFALTNTSKLANTATTTNSPQFNNPVVPWDGAGNDFDNNTFGLTRGFNSQGDGAASEQADIITDDADATGVTIVGTWTSSTATAGYYGTDYIYDGNTGQGTKSVTFTPNLPRAGTYKVYARWTATTNRATNVPIDITSSTGTATVTVNQQNNGGVWVLLGTYDFPHGQYGTVKIRNTATNGYVIADAVRFLQQ